MIIFSPMRAGGKIGDNFYVYGNSGVGSNRVLREPLIQIVDVALITEFVTIIFFCRGYILVI